MSLWRRPSGIYESHIMVDGVRYRKSTGTNNRRLAHAIDRKHEDDLLASRFQVEQQAFDLAMKFSELATRFLADGAKEWHRERMKVFLPFFANHEIGHINKALVRKYRAHRHSQKKLTETTINRDIECLRHILYWAVDQAILPANPLSRLRMEKPRRKKRPVMSVVDEEKIISAAAPHLREIILWARDTGMRRGELLSQLWQDVDLARKVISVSHSKTAEGEHREIPLTQRLVGLLSRNQQREGLVFTFKGKPITRIKTAWSGAIRRAQVQAYRFKDLRSTFNSRLIEAGIIKDIRKELMGHSRNEDTNDLYSHIELPLLREAIRKFEEWHTRELARIKEVTDTAQTPAVIE
jgi:integrase